MSKRGFQRSVRRVLGSLAVCAASAGLCAGMLAWVSASEAADGVKALLLSGFGTDEGLQKTLLYWPLLILTGLSVATAWKAGIFHVGAQGQFIIGVLSTLTGALLFSLPWWACLLLAAIGGALWGLLAGALKYRSRVSEILSAVMLNYIALYLTQWVWEDALSGLGENASLARAAMPALLLGDGLAVSLGLPVSLLLCLALWIVMRFTVLGFEMKTLGANEKAAKRAGMPVGRNKMLAVAVSGAFAGLAGGMCILSGMMDYSLPVISFQMGFTGIPVALMAFSHPLGTAVTALAAAGIYAGSERLPAVYPQETGMILFALMLLGSAALYRKTKKHDSQKSKG